MNITNITKCPECKSYATAEDLQDFDGECPQCGHLLDRGIATNSGLHIAATHMPLYAAV